MNNNAYLMVLLCVYAASACTAETTRPSTRTDPSEGEPGMSSEDADKPGGTMDELEPSMPTDGSSSDEEPTKPMVVVTVIGGDDDPQAGGGEPDNGGQPTPMDEITVVDDDSSLSEALCDMTTEPLRTAKALRGTWDKHVGTTYQGFGGQAGYPCRGFDFQEIPALDDPGWMQADDPTNIGFSEPSTFCMVDAGVPHGIGEFTYFRSNIWIPPATPQVLDGGVEMPGFALASLEVNLYGIDDSVKLWIYNSRHPDGFTPPNNAACAPNGNFTYDFGTEVVPNETNTIVMVHMDSQCASSALMTATISANGEMLEPAIDCM